MVYSVVSFSIMYFIVTYLNRFSVYQIVFFRAIATLSLTTPLILKQKIPILGNNKRLLLLRAILGVLSMTLFFLSIKYLGIGVSVSIRYLSPLFATIFALFFLKEKVKPIQWVLILLALLGVFLINGFEQNISSIGILFALLSAITVGLIFVITSKIGNSESPLVIVNYFMFLTLIFGASTSFNYWINPNLKELFLLLSSGVFGFIAVFYMTKSFQNSKINIVAPIKYLEVIISVIIGFFYFGERYTAWTFLGISLILVSIINNLYFRIKPSS
ncbi:DMT family transporter [Flavobacteriaceae bacterium]|nr:DMT family transporter [Flavobacteriaceae bacterium]